MKRTVEFHPNVFIIFPTIFFEWEAAIHISFAWFNMVASIELDQKPKSHGI